MKTQDHLLNSERRQFLMNVGVAVLAMETLPALAQSQSRGSREWNEPEHLPQVVDSKLQVNSGYGFTPHRHDLLIPMSLLKYPPRDGVKLKTTTNYYHSHSVVLSPQDLLKIKNGHEVIVRDSTVSEHVFKIYLPKN